MSKELSALVLGVGIAALAVVTVQLFMLLCGMIGFTNTSNIALTLLFVVIAILWRKK